MSVAGDYRSGKAIALPHHSLYEARLLRIVAQHRTDLADSRVDAVVYIDEDVFAPKPLDDFLAGHQLPVPLD